jgi:ABC-type Mn2+/Zn2+ transport system ATPase subunit
MALMSSPKLILMDEVSNGVDPISRKNRYMNLRALKNTSMLYINHRIDEAEKICDKIILSKFNFKFNSWRKYSNHAPIYSIYLNTNYCKLL